MKWKELSTLRKSCFIISCLCLIVGIALDVAGVTDDVELFDGILIYIGWHSMYIAAWMDKSATRIGFFITAVYGLLRILLKVLL